MGTWISAGLLHGAFHVGSCLISYRCGQNRGIRNTYDATVKACRASREAELDRQADFSFRRGAAAAGLAVSLELTGLADRLAKSGRAVLVEDDDEAEAA